MTSRGSWYADLLLVLLGTGLCAAGVLAGLDGVVRYAVAAPLVLLLPGYALVAALFPEGGEAGAELGPFDASPQRVSTVVPGAGAPGAVARLALSVLLSVSVVALVALASNLTRWGMALRPVLGGLVATIGLLLSIASVRRLRVPPRERATVSLDGVAPGFAAGRSRIGSSPTWERTVPNAALAAGLLVLVAGVGYAAVAPPSPQGFTEFYVETENATGDVRTLYPEQYAAGEQQELDVYVGNREGRETAYTVVGVLQRVERDDGRVSVQEASVVGRTSATVADGTTARVALPVRPGKTGENLRLVVLLYRGSPPENPTAENAYRVLRLGVDVSGGGSAALGTPETRRTG